MKIKLDITTENIEKALRTDHILFKIVTAAQMGLPAVTFIGDDLLSIFGDEIKGDMWKRQVGLIVKKILEEFNFVVSKQNVLTPNSQLFTMGSCYVKREK